MTPKEKQHKLMQLELKNARQILESMDVVSLPTEILKLQSILTSTEFPDVQEVNELISQNETLAGDVIKLANSVLFAGTQPVHSIKEAVNRLGTDKLKNLVLSMTMKNTMLDLGLKDITSHSVEVARVCAELARHSELISPDEAYLLGLFHNIGALMMAVKYPQYEECFFHGLTSPLTTYHKEERTYHTTHGYFGVVIAEKWALDDEVKKVMLLHHNENLSAIKNDRLRALVALIQLSNGIVSEMLFGVYVSEELKTMMESARQVLMVSPETLSEIRVSLLAGTLGDEQD